MVDRGAGIFVDSAQLVALTNVTIASNVAGAQARARGGGGGGDVGGRTEGRGAGRCQEKWGGRRAEQYRGSPSKARRCACWGRRLPRRGLDAHSGASCALTSCPNRPCGCLQGGGMYCNTGAQAGGQPAQLTGVQMRNNSAALGGGIFAYTQCRQARQWRACFPAVLLLLASDRMSRCQRQHQCP